MCNDCNDNLTKKGKVSKFKESAAKSGISFGSALVMVISYTTWHSVGWAIVKDL